MKPRVCVRVVVCTLALAVGANWIGAQERTEHPVPPQQPVRNAAAAPSVAPAYDLFMVSTGMPGLSGVGVYPTGTTALYGSDYDLWAYEDLVQKYVLGAPYGYALHAGRYNGGFFMGDDGGNVFRLFEFPDGPHWIFLANVGWGFIGGLDVDPVTRAVYFVENYHQNLYRLPKGSSTPEYVTWMPFRSWGVAVRGDYLYISDTYGGNIYRMKKTGGAMTLYASGLSGPCDIARDTAGNLYIAEFFGGSIAKIKVGTTTVTRIATGFFYPYYLGVNLEGSICFSDLGSWTVWVLRKK